MKKLLSTPFGEDQEVVVMSEISEEAVGASAEPTADELGRLRDILFGSQSRTIEKRLADLETGLQAARREWNEALQDKTDKTSGTAASQLTEARAEFNRSLEALENDQNTRLRSAQKDLTERLERQVSEQGLQLRDEQKNLSDRLDRLETDFINQLRAARKDLADQIEKMGSDQTERLRDLQTETRQRDEGLRQELLELAATLDDKKTSRHELSQMLIELGLRLRRDTDTSST